MEESSSSEAKKILTLDSTFEVETEDSNVWKLKDGSTLDVELCGHYEGIIEFSIPALMIESYIDLRDETINLALKNQLKFEIETYISEKDEKLTPKAAKLKTKLLELFERK